MSNRHHGDGRTSAEIVAALRELIEALDRRLPQMQRASEAQIAHDAATLRRVAVARIEELTRIAACEVSPLPAA